MGLEFKKRWLSCDSNDDNVKFPVGENKFEIKQRILKAVSRLSLESPHNSIGFSSHGFIIKQLVIAYGSDENIGFKNCEIAHLEFDVKKYDVKDLKKAFRFVKRMRTDKIEGKKSFVKEHKKHRDISFTSFVVREKKSNTSNLKIDKNILFKTDL